MLQQIDGLCRNWHDVVITKLGDTVTWEVDGHLLATVDTTKIMFGGENILIGEALGAPLSLWMMRQSTQRGTGRDEAAAYAVLALALRSRLQYW